MIAKKLDNIPVVVDQNRYRGATYIIEKFQPDIIILDDAFQHRSLERDLDIVLLNSQAPISDYKLIPHGLLREPMSHLKRADIIVFTKSEQLQPHKKVLNHAKKTKLPIFYSSVTLSGFSKNNLIFASVRRFYRKSNLALASYRQVPGLVVVFLCVRMYVRSKRFFVCQCAFSAFHMTTASVKLKMLRNKAFPLNCCKRQIQNASS